MHRQPSRQKNGSHAKRRRQEMARRKMHAPSHRSMAERGYSRPSKKIKMYFCRILAACISRRHLHARGNKQLFLDLAPSWPLLAWAPNRVASPKRRERVGKVRQKDETRLELAGPGKGSPSGARKCSKKPLAPRGRGDAFMQPTAWTRRAWPRAPKCNLLPALFRCTRLEASFKVDNENDDYAAARPSPSSWRDHSP